jgi:hypothetical protein
MNHADAASFLRFFPGLLTFQTKCDDPGASEDLRRRLTQVLHGDYVKLAGKLEVMNELGAGIYFSVAETDGEGRKLENIRYLRGLVCEWDYEAVNHFPLIPSLFVESSPGKTQAYWLLATPLEATPENIRRWKALEAGMVRTMKGDEGAKLVTQVLRVPGFTNNKYPARPTVRWIDAGKKDVQRYTMEELEAAWAPLEVAGGNFPETDAEILPGEYALPDEAVRIRRFTAWLTPQIPPAAGKGERNRWYYARVKAGVNDFAIDDNEALAELLADHSFRYHGNAAYDEDDVRRLIRNARRSSNGLPRGCKFAPKAPSFVPSIGGEG